MLNQSGPALYNGTVYVGSRDGYFYAINMSDGSLKWRFSANGISLEQSSPTVSNGIVYIGGWYDVPGFTRKGSLYAVNATTGQLVWEGLTNTGISSSPTVANGIVFITGDDLNLSALDAATGAIRWQKQILPNSASPAVSNGIVYVGGGGSHYIYAFDAATGTQKWRYNTTGLMTSCPLIVTSAGTADYAGDSGMLN
jgi:outer membrane protein assembly factor BamB